MKILLTLISMISLFPTLSQAFDVSLSWQRVPLAVAYEIQSSTDCGETWIMVKQYPAVPGLIQKVTVKGLPDKAPIVLLRARAVNKKGTLSDPSDFGAWVKPAEVTPVGSPTKVKIP